MGIDASVDEVLKGQEVYLLPKEVRSLSVESQRALKEANQFKKRSKTAPEYLPPIAAVQEKLLEEQLSQQAKELGDIHPYSEVHELTTPDAVVLMHYLSKQGVNIGLLPYAALAKTNHLTGEPLETNIDRVDYIKELYLSKGKRPFFNTMIQTNVELSEREYAERILLRHLWYEIQQKTPQMVDLSTEYRKAFYQVSTSQLKMLRSSNSLRQEEISFVKDALFDSPAPEPTFWYYSPGHVVDVPLQTRRVKMKVEGYIGERDVRLSGGGISVLVDKGYVDSWTKPTFAEKASFFARIPLVVIGGMIEAAQLRAVSLAELGAFRRAKGEDYDGWVLYPNARLRPDPHEHEVDQYRSNDNNNFKPFEILKQQGVKVITPQHLEELKAQGYPIKTTTSPMVRVDGLSLQSLEHHRIRAAQDVGLGIVVSPVKGTTTLN